MKNSKVIDKFNKKAKEWLTELVATDEVDLQIKPASDSWSLAEVYDHVMRVTRTYQIPHLKKSVSVDAELKKRKNPFGFLLFDLNILPRINISMTTFPSEISAMFTPVMRSKSELVKDFREFIKEVNDLEKYLEDRGNSHKQFHPMFGDISTKDWFRLVEIHIRHHDKQKKKIRRYIKESKEDLHNLAAQN